MAFLVLQLRSGDMVSMHRLFLSRNSAWQYLMQAADTSTSWWKILEIPDANLDVNNNVEIAIRVRWETSNRVTYVGTYAPNNAPNNLDSEDIFVELMLVHP